MTIITRYKCFCCQVSFEKHRIHGFDWKDGVWGDLEFDDPDETGKHICRVCLNELGRMISNVADPEDTEPEPQKAVSLGRNSFAARSLAEQTLAADQAEPESVKNTCCNCASQFLDTQKHNDFRLMVEAMEIIKAIETLREGGGRFSVHPMFGLQTSIGVVGDWTHMEWQTFRGDTLHAALAAAVEARLEKR